MMWPEIRDGDDLVSLVCAVEGLRDGDVVVVTSKIVSKAEGRLVHGTREAAIAAETRRVVARRGTAVIAETRHGLVMAAAGVDASNTPAGTALLLPRDPDASARGLRRGVYDAVGINIAVVLSDTAGRAWRLGQTDMAVGCAGIAPLLDLRGTEDTQGNELQVTAAAVADEIAAAADLVKGKTSHRPVAVVHGLAEAVLPPGLDGPGAESLLRGRADDLFGLGVREAVVAAAQRIDIQALEHFPSLAPGDDQPFHGVFDGWRAAQSLTRRRQVRGELAAWACPDAPSSPAWSLQMVVGGDADVEVLLAVGRLLERADVIAAAHRLVGHEPADTPGESSGHRKFRRCWHVR